MKSRMQRTTALLGVMCFVGLTGAPPALIQLWGWGSMFVRFAEHMPAGQALQLTMSGSRLCGACEVVNAASEQAQDDAVQQILQDIRLFLPVPDGRSRVRLAQASPARAHSETAPAARHERPGVPPPRAGLRA